MLKATLVRTWVTASLAATVLFLFAGSADAALTATITPEPVSNTTLSTTTKIIPISGVTDSTTGVARFKFVSDEAGTLRVSLKGQFFPISTTQTSFGTTSDNLTFNFALRKHMGSLVLDDESNTLGIDFKPETGTFANVANYIVFVDNVAPNPVRGISADGADKAILVSWDAPAKSGTEVINAYKVFYSETPFTSSATEAANQKSKTVDVKTDQTTSTTIGDLSNGTTYYVTVIAEDWVGFQSDFTRTSDHVIFSASATPVHTVSLAELAGENGGCFIATAAYGSYEEPHVQLLRRFRDEVLLRTPSGESFVRWYYRTSPPYADWIARHDAVRAVTRVLLLPLFALAYVSLYPAWLMALGMILLMLAAGVRKLSLQDSK